ncbi:NHLP leader peptide family RiPP precursor [Novispirillum itersonii]|uniref:Nitrile hydratase alpha/Thiocyanate hydrolase gamma domain-containing protein n=1 Tax=Novispirillum itersonii TaxID=189 RepID=A0A7W9ZC59_NOVIT|nr:NHLP leader peptide family RiPP precursor [Novispirillum itersonii]MBB6208716.1 hypothetical protein [Novispirillum itersonii]
MATLEQYLDQRLDDYRAVVLKAQTDPVFRAALLADPKAALKAAFGVEIPAGIAVSVVEETAQALTLVLPQAPVAAASNDDALSDDDLEAVAAGGGKGLWNYMNKQRNPH